MNISQIEPKFEQLEEGVDGAMKQIGGLEKRLEQIAARLGEHEQLTADDAHSREVDEGELTPTERVFKAAADAADSPLQAAVDATQKLETPTEITEEAVETVINGHEAPAEAIFEQVSEEVVEKVATEVDDATFPEPEPEPEPETVEPVATVEVVISGNVDPRTKGLLESLKYVDNDLVKVTINERK
ncbi:hypothetical protein F4009_05520 [Candidatus Poribacteria bacterium]|nr:hypothetical protein [Candidatus Poribacteria bacterium]MYH83484.1 hypothetical protein [Candidatus Poribacteria bacterium]MYK93446.1 hypothetical protein [Candidatus Poribacteria bacterium]